MPRRPPTILTAATAAAALAATPALAHVDVVRTSPGSGKSARVTTRTVTVTFKGRFTTGKLTVTGPDGRVVGTGSRDPRKTRQLLAELRSGLRPGRYKASWRILNDDGHRVKGSFRFTLRR